MDLKGSKTEQNLITAYAGESEARNKYTYYASQALKDGYVQIANIFTETANNEKEHAKIWYKLLHNGIGNTEENLKLGAEGEHFEWAEMYKSFAEEAKEGWFDIKKPFSNNHKLRRLIRNWNKNQSDLTFQYDATDNTVTAEGDFDKDQTAEELLRYLDRLLDTYFDTGEEE